MIGSCWWLRDGDVLVTVLTPRSALLMAIKPGGSRGTKVLGLVLSVDSIMHTRVESASVSDWLADCTLACAPTVVIVCSKPRGSAL